MMHMCVCVCVCIVTCVYVVYTSYVMYEANVMRSRLCVVCVGVHVHAFALVRMLCV